MLAFTLLLVGAGCSNTTTPSNQDTSTDSPSKDGSTVEQQTATGYSIQLKATAVGARQVKFEWEMNGNLTEPTRFILLRSENANPTHDGNTYWFRQPGNRHSATWVNLPPGEQHFRICTSNDGDECVIYSDDITLEILSGPAPIQIQKETASPTTENTTDDMTSVEPTPLETEYAISDTTSTEEMTLIEEVTTTTPEMEVPTTDTISTESMSTSTEETMTETSTTTDSSTSTNS